MSAIKTLQISFTNEIENHEIPLLRGAIIHSLENKLPLFHNHTPNGFRYSYPMILYKRIRKKANLLCLGEGVEQVGEFFATANHAVKLGQREVNLEIENITPQQFRVQVWDDTFYYRMRKWIPLNSTNYEEYMQLESLTSKIQFLERILIGNILSFAKGMNIFFEETIACTISNIIGQREIKHKGVKFLAFDIDFTSNVSLPNYIGLGKGVSLNFGTITQFRPKG